MAAVKDKAIPLNYEQKVTLVRLIKDNDSIRDKKTDHNSVENKRRAWQQVTDDFNSSYPLTIPPKTSTQLKRAWEYIRTK